MKPFLTLLYSVLLVSSAHAYQRPVTAHPVAWGAPIQPMQAVHPMYAMPPVYRYPPPVMPQPWQRPAPPRWQAQMLPPTYAQPSMPAPVEESIAPAVSTLPGSSLQDSTPREPAKVQSSKPITVEPPIAEAKNTPEQSKKPQQADLPASLLGLDQQKMAFLNQLTPMIERENARVLETRQRVLQAYQQLHKGTLDDQGRIWLRQLAREHRVKHNPLEQADARAELLSKVDIIPVALVLAQAVNESAWGTSRFAREGNNLFGIWTYDPEQGIVPKGRAEGAKHLVRRFDSLQDSVRYYLHNLNSHPAYQELREMRAQMRTLNQPIDALQLAAGLIRYSAKGERYVELIRDLIERYDLVAMAERLPAKAG